MAAAGPSSLKVTWKKAIDNNSPITKYELEYKAYGTTGWLPALIPEALATASKPSYTIEGLAPGRYDVQVRAWNQLGEGDWKMGGGSTGAGPGTPTLTLKVDATLPEGRNMIPVTVTATVPPSAMPLRELKVTLTLKGTPKTLPEDAAELRNPEPPSMKT